MSVRQSNSVTLDVAKQGEGRGWFFRKRKMPRRFTGADRELRYAQNHVIVAIQGMYVARCGICAKGRGSRALEWLNKCRTEVVCTLGAIGVRIDGPDSSTSVRSSTLSGST